MRTLMDQNTFPNFAYFQIRFLHCEDSCSTRWHKCSLCCRSPTIVWI